MAHHKSLEYFAHLENSPAYHDLKTHPIVYMCAEYALSADLEIYAGGLGVLAADTMMEARDRNFPMIWWNEFPNDLHGVGFCFF